MRALGVVICAVVALTASSSGATVRSPTLAITDRQPLTVRGARFAPYEKVKLLVSASAPLTRSVRAGPRGGFTTVFRVALGRCDAVAVQAFGSRGSRAEVDVTQVACAPDP